MTHTQRDNLHQHRRLMFLAKVQLWRLNLLKRIRFQKSKNPPMILTIHQLTLMTLTKKQRRSVEQQKRLSLQPQLQQNLLLPHPQQQWLQFNQFLLLPLLRLFQHNKLSNKRLKTHYSTYFQVFQRLQPQYSNNHNRQHLDSSALRIKLSPLHRLPCSMA